MENQIISTKLELLNVVELVTDKINNHEWEQISVETDPFCTHMDIRKIYSERIFPDILQCYFRDIKTMEVYLLSVETYHGSGGYLKKQE